MKIDLSTDAELRLVRCVDVLRETPEWAPLMGAAIPLGRSKAGRNLLMDTAAHIVFEEGLRAVLAKKGAP